MPLLELAEKNLTLVYSMLSTLLLLIPKVRAGIKRLWKWAGILFGGHKIDLILDKVTYIEKEMQFNGGNSLRDIVMIQVNRQKAQFWRSVKPALEMDKDAQVQLVSETLCHLLKVSDPHQLYLRNYLNCVGGHVDDFLDCFKECVKYNSCINFELPLRTIEGESLGLWEIRLSPMTPPNSHRPLYSGYLKPACEVAEALAAGLM